MCCFFNGCWCFSYSSWDQAPVRVEVGPEKKQASFGLTGGAAMRCSTLLAIFTGVILYLVLGAVVFQSLEAPLEEEEYMSLLSSLQNKSTHFLLNNSCIDPEMLQNFLQVQHAIFSWQEMFIILNHFPPSYKLGSSCLFVTSANYSASVRQTIEIFKYWVPSIEKKSFCFGPTPQLHFTRFEFVFNIKYLSN